MKWNDWNGLKIILYSFGRKIDVRASNKCGFRWVKGRNRVDVFKSILNMIMIIITITLLITLLITSSLLLNRNEEILNIKIHTMYKEHLKFLPIDCISLIHFQQHRKKWVRKQILHFHKRGIIVKHEINSQSKYDRRMKMEMNLLV